MIQQRIMLRDDGKASLTIYLHEAFKSRYPEQPSWYPQRRPFLLIVPGGSYQYVSDREGDPVALHFLKAGYHCGILRYHVGEDAYYPNPLKDIAEALKHLRANSEAYHLDQDQIAVLGFSAGGHLVALLASVFHRQQVLEDIGYEKEEIRPNALLLGYPLVHLGEATKDLHRERTEFLTQLEAAYDDKVDPMQLIHDEYPPCFLFMTREDETLSAIDSLHYGLELLRQGIPTEIHLFDKGIHGLATGDALSNYGRDIDPRFQGWIPLAISWLDQQFQKK